MPVTRIRKNAYIRFQYDEFDIENCQSNLVDIEGKIEKITADIDISPDGTEYISVFLYINGRPYLRSLIEKNSIEILQPAW